MELLCAIAYQESGSIWSRLIGKLPPEQIPALCTGDTLDAPKRKAFPRNKAELLTHPRGEELFAIARTALLEMARWVPAYAKTAAIPTKFCHGFGIFQLDLQHVHTHPNFFLKQQWHDFSLCLQHGLQQLQQARARMGWSAKRTLTTAEQIYVAIAYNKGKADPTRGYQQGYKSPDGTYYGEHIAAYLAIATRLTRPAKKYRVKPSVTALNLRKTPRIPKTKPESNVLLKLRGGQALQIIEKAPENPWIKVQVTIDKKSYMGFVSGEYVEEYG